MKEQFLEVVRDIEEAERVYELFQQAVQSEGSVVLDVRQNPVLVATMDVQEYSSTLPWNLASLPMVGHPDDVLNHWIVLFSNMSGTHIPYLVGPKWNSNSCFADAVTTAMFFPTNSPYLKLLFNNRSRTKPVICNSEADSDGFTPEQLDEINKDIKKWISSSYYGTIKVCHNLRNVIDSCFNVENQSGMGDPDEYFVAVAELLGAPLIHKTSMSTYIMSEVTESSDVTSNHLYSIATASGMYFENETVLKLFEGDPGSEGVSTIVEVLDNFRGQEEVIKTDTSDYSSSRAIVTTLSRRIDQNNYDKRVIIPPEVYELKDGRILQLRSVVCNSGMRHYISFMNFNSNWYKSDDLGESNFKKVSSGSASKHINTQGRLFFYW